VELTRQCVDLEPALAESTSGLGALTRYAWEYRYPGEAEPPSLELARSWTLRVSELLRAVESFLPPQAIT
jgi:hypothetical protein